MLRATAMSRVTSLRCVQSHLLHICGDLPLKFNGRSAVCPVADHAVVPSPEDTYSVRKLILFSERYVRTLTFYIASRRYYV